MIEIGVVFLVLGCIAGLIGGLFGVGGGIIMVPILAVMFQFQGFPEDHIMHLALGTSLAAVVFTSVAATIEHQKKKAVSWCIVAWFAPGLMLGGLLGAAVADLFSSIVLQRIFGLFEIAMGVYMFMGAAITTQLRKRLASIELIGTGTLIGALSTIMGIGGGTMTVPYLNWRGRAMTEAVASSSACGFVISLFGSLGYLYVGMDAQGLPEYTLGYLYCPAFVLLGIGTLIFAPVGARLAHRLPVSNLKYLFSIILFVVGCAMLWSSWA